MDDDVENTSVIVVSTLELLGVGKISVMIVGVYVVVDSAGPSELEDEVGNTSVIVVSTTELTVM